MKKLYVFGIIAVMVVSFGLLTGCADAGVGGSGYAPGTREVDLTATMPDDAPVLRLLLPFQGFDPNTEPVAYAIRNMTGINVQYETLPAENAEIVLTATLAAREEFDLMVITMGLFNATVAIGAYEPLNDWLPTHVPNALANTDPALFLGVTLNGEILGIPEGGTSVGFSGTVMRGRLDMFRQAGLNRMPTTIDEFYNAAVFIRDELGITPMTIWPLHTVIPEFGSAFGIFYTWNVVNGQVLHAVEHPNMLDYVTWMNHLFNTGIIDVEYATLNAAMMNERFFTGQTALYYVAFWNEPGATNTIMEAFPYAELAFLPPLAGPDGTSGFAKVRGINRVVVVPRVAPNKDLTFEFLNMMNSVEGFRHVFIGEEGVHWYHDGTYYAPIDPTFDDERGNASHFTAGHVTAEAATFWLEIRARRNLMLFEHLNEATHVTFEAPNYFTITSFLPPIEVFLRNAPASNEFAHNSVIQFIAGARPLSEWDTFLQEWRAHYHGTTLTNVINEWWSEEGDAILPQMGTVVNPAR